MNEIIFLNGRFVSDGQAEASVLTPGFLYGWGLFETMRSYCQNIVYLDWHLKRIRQGGALIGLKMPYSDLRVKRIIRAALAKSVFKDNYVRLSVWRSGARAEAMFLVKKYTPYSARKYEEGFCCFVSPFRQNERSPLARVKSNNRLLYQCAYEAARKKGFDEALLLNTAGYLAEASRSNIFFVKDGRVFTPSLACGCLAGVTRQVVFDLCRKYGIRVRQGRWRLKDLLGAQGAFLTNSGMGVMPAASVGRKLIAGGSQSGIVRLLVDEYQKLLKNED